MMGLDMLIEGDFNVSGEVILARDEMGWDGILFLRLS
jgi:hypothetical protein